MSLAETLDADIKAAMKAGEKDRLTVLRGLKSDIKYAAIGGTELTDEAVIGVLTSAAKKRRDAIEQYRAGGRDDLVAKESAELEIIQAYLPQQLTDEELTSIIAETVAAVGASTPADMGKVMGQLMPKVKGKADGKRVNELVKAALAG